MKKKKLNTKKIFGAIAKTIILILVIIALGYAGAEDQKNDQEYSNFCITTYNYDYTQN